MSNFKISYDEIQKSRRLVESIINFKNKLSSDHLIIQLERYSKYGDGPVYSITIYGDGRVLYEGFKNVMVVGIKNGYITRDKLNELLKEFQNAYFFSFNDVYSDPGNRDMLGYLTTSITINNDSKKVTRYENCVRPTGLIELENSIDRIVNSKQWTGAGERI
jgi:hypothetical protein